MKTLYFSDTSSTYAMQDDEIIELTSSPKIVDLHSLSAQDMLHCAIELDKTAQNISPLLYAKALEKGIFSQPPQAYSSYFVQREHLFDEQKYVYESFFYAPKYAPKKAHKSRPKPLPKCRILTSDIFLPLALRHDRAFIVLIPPYLCYFENTAQNNIQNIAMPNIAMKEVLHLTSQAPQASAQSLSSAISYLQEAHGQKLDIMYYFTQNMAMLDSLIPTAPVPMLPLSDIAPQTKGMSFHAFRAFLAFEYIKKLHQSPLALPNFAKKPPIYVRFSPVFIASVMIFVLVLPFALSLYNQHLQSKISALHAQNTQLLNPPDSQENIDIQSLTAQHNTLKQILADLSMWQGSYAKRYAFMQSIFAQCLAYNAHLQSIDFAFSQSHFIATLRLKTSSRIDTSAFIAQLNSNTQSAFLQAPASALSDSWQDISHIVVVQHVF